MVVGKCLTLSVNSPIYTGHEHPSTRIRSRRPDSAHACGRDPRDLDRHASRVAKPPGSPGSGGCGGSASERALPLLRVGRPRARQADRGAEGRVVTVATNQFKRSAPATPRGEARGEAWLGPSPHVRVGLVNASLCSPRADLRPHFFTRASRVGTSPVGRGEVRLGWARLCVAWRGESVNPIPASAGITSSPSATGGISPIRVAWLGGAWLGTARRVAACRGLNDNTSPV